MSHKGIRLLLEDTAKSLGDDIQFDYGRTSDFNLLRDKRYPFISVSPLTVNAFFAVNNASNYSRSYQVQIAFYQLDNDASTQEEYALILDEMADLADKFINKINTYIQGDCIGSDDLTITGISMQPFIKVTADVLTGYIMTFTAQVADNFNYCEIGC